MNDIHSTRILKEARMSQSRTVRTIIKSNPTLESVGVRLKRVRNNGVPLFDPFLLRDDFRSSYPATDSAW
jgi:hypothetical protein